MPSVIASFEYDVFISYRQNDNRREGWVTQFVESLRDELEATSKEKINIYFDANPHDGLLETHQVDESLRKKLKCLIFIPIISKTYCDPHCFAWEQEFLPFLEMAKNDAHGLKVELPSGNTSSRVLPVKIHDLDQPDTELLEKELGHLRSVDFVYSSSGVNRPLSAEDDPGRNSNGTIYRDQLNKVANAINDIIAGAKLHSSTSTAKSKEPDDHTSTEKKSENGPSWKNVVRPAITYVITAAILVRLVHVLQGTLPIPEQLPFFLTLALVVLFPLAVLLAWKYERSPQGFIRTGSANNPYSDSKKKPLTSNTFIILFSITLAVLLFISPGQFHYSSEQEDKSIAVLAFTDMSPQRDQQHFSDGISEELINALSRLPGVKVVGRASSFFFKGKDVSVQDIGKELGVVNILDGSVRKSGNQLRVTVTLINTENGFSKWNNTYNMELTDAFTIQDQITSAIIDQLEIQLSDTDEIQIQKTSNITAYEVYLTARQKLAARNEGILEAQELFAQVIELDPDYSPAYSGLGRAYTLAPGWFPIDDADEIYTKAKKYALEALELDPQNAEAYSVLGSVSMFYDWDFETAQNYFEQSFELNPNDGEIINFLGDFYSYTGHPKAIEIETKSLQVDPLHPAKYNDLSFAYLFVGEPEKAAEMALKAMELDSFLLSPLGNYIDAQIMMNNYREAERMLNIYPAADTYTQVLGTALLAANKSDRGQLDDVEERVLTAYEAGETDAARVAEFYHLIGNDSTAAKWVEIAYEDKEYYLIASFILFLPEDIDASDELLAALDKPGLNRLFEIRRQNRAMDQLKN